MNKYKKLKDFYKTLNTFKSTIRFTNTESTNSTNSSSNKSRNPPGIDLRTFKSSRKTNKYETRDDYDRGNYREGSKSDINYGSAAILASIPIATFCLGCWQIQRRKWKLDLIEMLESRTKSKPMELPTDLNELKNIDYEYRPIKVKGRFDHRREIILTPRHDITGTYSKPGGYVITPFIVSGRQDLTILVNRGFVPHTNYSLSTREKGQINDEIEITGLLRFNETRNTFTPDNRPHKNEWHCRDVDTMAICLDTQPIFIDADYRSTISGGPIGGQTHVQLRNEHLSYIFTWFSLSALTSIMWFMKFVVKKF